MDVFNYFLFVYSHILVVFAESVSFETVALLNLGRTKLDTLTYLEFQQNKVLLVRSLLTEETVGKFDNFRNLKVIHNLFSFTSLTINTDWLPKDIDRYINFEDILLFLKIYSNNVLIDVQYCIRKWVQGN